MYNNGLSHKRLGQRLKFNASICDWDIGKQVPQQIDLRNLEHLLKYICPNLICIVPLFFPNHPTTLDCTYYKCVRLLED